MINSGGLLDLDPHKNSLAWHSAMHDARRKTPFVLDTLDRIDDVLPIPVVEPSSKKGLVALHENMENVRAMTELFVYRQGTTSLARRSKQERWAVHGFLCWMYQKTRKRIHPIVDLFDPASEVHREWVEDCLYEPVREKFRRLRDLSRSALENEVGSTIRMLEPFCTNPSFMARDVPPSDRWNPIDFLNSGGHIHIEGGRVSEETKLILLGLWAQRIIQEARRGAFRTVVRLVIDEAHKVVVGNYIGDGHRELRKSNLAITTIWQSPPTSRRLREDILQNLKRLEVFGCHSPDTARFCASQLAGPRATSDNLYKRIRYYQTAIMRLGVGWRFVRRGNYVSFEPEYVHLPKEPYPWRKLTARKTKIAIEKAIREYGIQPSLTGAMCTRQRSTKSCGGSRSFTESVSPATRLRREGWGGWENARSSDSSEK
jgi:hypothetical protein